MLKYQANMCEYVWQNEKIMQILSSAAFEVKHVADIFVWEKHTTAAKKSQGMQCNFESTWLNPITTQFAAPSEKGCEN